MSFKKVFEMSDRQITVVFSILRHSILDDLGPEEIAAFLGVVDVRLLF